MYINVKNQFYQQISGKEIYENKYMKRSNGVTPHNFDTYLIIICKL